MFHAVSKLALRGGASSMLTAWGGVVDFELCGIKEIFPGYEHRNECSVQ